MNCSTVMVLQDLPLQGVESQGAPQGPMTPGTPASPAEPGASLPPPPPQPAVFVPSSWLPLATAANMNCLAEKLKESTSFMKDWTSKHSLSGSKAGKRKASVGDRPAEREGGARRLAVWRSQRPARGLPGCKGAPSPEGQDWGPPPCPSLTRGLGAASRRHSPGCPDLVGHSPNFKMTPELALHL